MKESGRRTATGRADLVRLLGTLPRDQHAHAAGALGFVRQKDPEPIADIAAEASDADVFATFRVLFHGRPAETSETGAVGDLRVPFLRFEHMEFTDEPQDEARRGPLGEMVNVDDLRSPGRSLLATPRAEPLLRWSRLWPKLRNALQSYFPSREVDIDSYVRRISRGAILQDIPRKKQSVWAGRFEVWIDRSMRLGAFWSDQQDVWQGLRKLCPKSGMTRRLLDVRTQMRLIRRQGDFLANWTNAPDTPILVLGDLGVYGSDAERAAWERTGRRLVERGMRLSGLVPGLSTRFSSFMTRTWNAWGWERERMRGAPEETWAERRDRLLKMVSPVALLQPGLLRAIRHLLPAALADASTEADVWNHEDVQAADATGWVLQPAACLKWRAAFAADRSLDPYREKLALTIRTWHANLPREIARGETLLWQALVPGIAPPGDMQDAVAFAKRLEATALAGRTGEPLLSFQKKLLEAMPSAIYEKVPALATVWVASFKEGEVPAGIDARALRDKLEAPGELQHWAVRQVGMDLEFFLNDRGSAWASHVEGPGSPMAWLEATRPWIYIERAGRVVQRRLENGMSLSMNMGERIVLRTDRCTVVLAPWDSQDEPGWIAAGQDRFGLWADADIYGIKQRFRWIPPGKFLMGSPENELGRNANEGPQHSVALTQGRWLGDTPVTLSLWSAVTGVNLSHFHGRGRSFGDYPVEHVNWYQCADFVADLGLRLPSEAEWEHACRAGTTTATWLGNFTSAESRVEMLDRIGWYRENSGHNEDEHSDGGVEAVIDDDGIIAGSPRARPVRQKEPNPFGLYDMLGNVYEWCQDAFYSYSAESVVDPVPKDVHNAARVSRGGSWSSVAWRLRAARRTLDSPGSSYNNIGLRFARDANPTDAKKRGPR